MAGVKNKKRPSRIHCLLVLHMLRLRVEIMLVSGIMARRWWMELVRLHLTSSKTFSLIRLWNFWSGVAAQKRRRNENNKLLFLLIAFYHIRYTSRACRSGCRQGTIQILVRNPKKKEKMSFVHVFVQGGWIVCRLWFQIDSTTTHRVLISALVRLYSSLPNDPRCARL